MLLLVAGCPATGKTGFAKWAYKDACIIDFDEWVTGYYNLPFVEAMDKYVAEFPESQHRYFNEIGRKYKDNPDVVVCDTFTYRKDREDFLCYIDKEFGIPKEEIKLLYLVAKYRTIEERNRKRSGAVPENIMLTMFYNQEFPTVSEKFGSVEIVANE